MKEIELFLLESIKKINQYEPDIISKSFENERVEGDPYIFIIKPEMLDMKISHDNLQKILSIVLDKFVENDISISSASIFNGKYSVKNAIPQNQYYTLNKFANYGVLNIHINEQFSKLVNPIGAYRFLELFPEITEEQLEEWAHENGSEKLENGMYVFNLKYQGKHYDILNAFHPFQIKHLSKAYNRFIVLCGWTSKKPHNLAFDVIGFFNPKKSNFGSIRNLFYTHQEELGVNISTIYNGIHISPSPLEALKTYGIYFPKNDIKLNEKILYLCEKSELTKSELINIFENQIVTYRGKTHSIFEFCEGKTFLEIINIIKECRGNV